MRTIAIEEHFSTPQCQAAAKKVTDQVFASPLMAGIGQKLLDLGEGRLSDMDAAASTCRCSR